MGRKIVLLSDGTGNSAAKVWRTNVWRVFESLDLSGSDQVAFYDDGVGTASFKPVAILGGAFGYGLKRNVIDIYKFACRNYRNDDDEIYGFGFSRGAFTMRVVTGVILEQGIVQANSESELHAKATAAYRAFRANNFHTRWPRWCRPEEWGRRLRGLLARSRYSDADNRKDVKVRFLGLWDTVAAYGMPVEEMARGLSQWIWPWMLPDCNLDPRVQRACHALSVDDERTTFHPVLWDERKEKPLLPDNAGQRHLARERISQVWFPGVHTNVGGGYPDDSVAQIPLIWMLAEAHACGLCFKSVSEANPQTFGHPNTVQDKDGRIYDPRKGLGGYYRYGPRDIAALGQDLLSRQGAEPLPRIHECVFRRIANRAHCYAPVGLPARYEVVTADGSILAPEQNPYESAAQALARWHGQERVWNTVWWRRIVYFLTVGVSIYLLAFPLMKAAPAEDEFTTPLRWVSEVVRAVGRFLPDAADPWMDDYAREPGRLLVVALLLAAMLLWGTRLAGRIQSRMEILWRNSLGSRLADPGKPTDPIYRLRTSPAYVRIRSALKTRIAPALFALLFFWLGVTLASHVLFNIQDDAGRICRETGTQATLASGEILLANGRTAKLDELAANARANPAISPADKSNPFKYAIALPEFQASQLCQSIGVSLERYGKYVITLESTDSFADWDGTIKAPFGYYSGGIIHEPPKPGSASGPGDGNEMSFLDWARMTALVPLRRELARPWFRVMARIGGTGGEESSLDPDFSDQFTIDEPLTATRNGELFLFVNDAVIGIPRLYDLFYRNNQGRTRVLIKRK